MVQKEKVLIHLHPSMSYIGRSLSICNQATQFCISLSPSIQRRNNHSFSKYLKKYFASKYFKNKLDIKISSNNIFKLFGLIKNAINIQLNNHSKNYLEDAIIDSILRRKLSSRLFYMSSKSNGIIRKIIRSIFRFYAFYCLFFYKALLLSEKPDKVILSHANYIEYATLIIASLTLKKKVIVIFGAFDKVIFFNKFLDVYHFVSYLRNFNYNIPNKKINLKYNYAKNSAINDKYLKYKRPNKDNLADTLIIATHCLADNNYVSNRNKMLFTTYYDWLAFTCKNLIINSKNSYKNVVFKIHPHIKTYGDLNLILRLIKNINCYSNKKIIICDEKQYLSDVIKTKEISAVFITFHGSIASEIGAKGLPLIACGEANGPLISQYNPSSQSEYIKIINNRIYATKCLSKLASSRKISLHNKRFNEFYFSLNPTDELEENLRFIRKYFNFDSIQRSPDEDLTKCLIKLLKYPIKEKIKLNNSWGVILPN